ncbi:MAG TPA: hypothetical protein VGE07_09640 [Herpetosiphonaceae bacterium]
MAYRIFWRWPARALLITLAGVLMFACGEQPAATAVPANHLLYGHMRPVRLFVIDEADAIRLKAECSTDHYHTGLVMRYQYADGAEAQTIDVQQEEWCSPGALIYESSPDAALPLVAGQAITIRATVQYRNGSTSNMTRTYRRDPSGALLADP